MCDRVSQSKARLFQRAFIRLCIHVVSITIGVRLQDVIFIKVFVLRCSYGGTQYQHEDSNVNGCFSISKIFNLLYQAKVQLSRSAQYALTKYRADGVISPHSKEPSAPVALSGSGEITLWARVAVIRVSAGARLECR